jgi:hypothetical protein
MVELPMNEAFEQFILKSRRYCEKGTCMRPSAHLMEVKGKLDKRWQLLAVCQEHFEQGAEPRPGESSSA